MMRRPTIHQVSEKTDESSRRNNSLPPGEQLYLKRMHDVDLSRLTDDELALLEKLIAKAEGKCEGRIIPPFIVEFVEAEADESRGMSEEK